MNGRGQMPPPAGDGMNAVQIVDRLGFKLVGAIARIFGAEAARDEESFYYGLNPNGFVDLTALIGNQIQGQINITQEADFVATRITQACVNPATGVPFAADTESYTVTIQDGSTDRQLTNVPQHVQAVFGNAKRSTPWTKNRLFRRNSSIFFTFTQLQAVATRIFISVWGYKVFDQASLDLTARRS
jgi:hypothetical protein